jgi:hypothetical protein
MPSPDRVPCNKHMNGEKQPKSTLFCIHLNRNGSISALLHLLELNSELDRHTRLLPSANVVP